MKYLRSLSDRIEEKIKVYLSHRPRLYALIVGIGIVLFWRGVWHGTDFLHSFFYMFQGNLTIDVTTSAWWDWAVSFIVGVVVLHYTGAFTSSFIGNELILSGLRGEKRLGQKTESEVKTEEQVVLEIKEELNKMAGKIGELEEEVHKQKHLK